MSEYMADIGDRLTAGSAAQIAQGVTIKKKGSNMDLDMSDFLMLMITEMTNQGLDSSMDTSEMVNQMVQMQMVTALANMTDASIMSYAASLVGKEVTVAKYTSDGIEELVGTVTGTGTKDGQQVVFLDNDKYYYMSEIMAVGRLPEKKEPEKTDGDDNKTEGSGSSTEKPGETGGSTSTPETGDKVENTENPGETGGSGEADEAPAGRDAATGRAFVPEAPLVSDTESEYHGENGVPTDTEV